MGKGKEKSANKSAGAGKPAGFHSRRNQTSEAQQSARATYESAHGPSARKKRAKERAQARARKTPRTQLASLDRRLGKGVGAQRERARLGARVGS